jgi:hypothetical protein
VTSALTRRWGDVAFEELVAHSAFGPRFSGSAYADDGNIATLRTTDLDDDGRISYETMPLAKLDEDRFGNHLLSAGDLVITRSGTCGIAAVFEGFSIPVLPGAFLIRFRMNERAEARFYRYYFNSPAGRSNILSVARGAVQQNLNITNVEALRVPLPPVSEQRRIVSILSAYDNLTREQPAANGTVGGGGAATLSGMVRPPPLPRPRAHPHHQRRAGRVAAKEARCCCGVKSRIFGKFL